MFWKLVEKSTVTSGIMAIALMCTVCYCVINQIEVPVYIVSVLSTVVGFFFSSKMKDQEARNRAAAS